MAVPHLPVSDQTGQISLPRSIMGHLILLLNIIWIFIWCVWKPQNRKSLKQKRCFVNLIQWLAIIINVGYLLTQIRMDLSGGLTAKDDPLFGVIVSAFILQLIIALTHTWSLFDKKIDALNNKIVFRLQPGTYEFSKDLDWSFAAVGVMRLSAAIKYKDIIIKMPDYFSCTGKECLRITCIPDPKSDQLYRCETYTVENKKYIKKTWLHYVYQWMALSNLGLLLAWFLFGEAHVLTGSAEYRILQCLFLGILGGWVSR